MINRTIYDDIAKRDGKYLIGVVGPVRTGKSTLSGALWMYWFPQITDSYENKDYG